jgi:myosin heavy subunit
MDDAEILVSKNLDTLPTDLRLQCSNPIINTARTKGRAGMPISPRSSGRAALQKVESNITAQTVSTKYKSQLAKLMSQLRKTRSRYIRCIMPNNKKTPTLMQHHTVAEFLR